jgi:CheY-like chemotaxis protein
MNKSVEQLKILVAHDSVMPVLTGIDVCREIRASAKDLLFRY